MVTAVTTFLHTGALVPPLGCCSQHSTATHTLPSEVSFPRSSLATTPLLLVYFLLGWQSPSAGRGVVNITSCRSATPTEHVTGLGFAGLVEEPAGLKRNKNPKLPSAVAQMMNISGAALTEPEPVREGPLQQLVSDLLHGAALQHVAGANPPRKGSFTSYRKGCEETSTLTY